MLYHIQFSHNCNDKIDLRFANQHNTELSKFTRFNLLLENFTCIASNRKFVIWKIPSFCDFSMPYSFSAVEREEKQEVNEH